MGNYVSSAVWIGLISSVSLLMQDCLPVCLMFEMKEEGESDPRKLAQMMQSLGVFISVKPKAKQTAKVLRSAFLARLIYSS